MKNTTVQIEEEERQVILLALAKLSIERPGWLDMIETLAAKMDNVNAQGKPQMLTQWREIHEGGESAHRAYHELLGTPQKKVQP